MKLETLIKRQVKKTIKKSVKQLTKVTKPKHKKAPSYNDSLSFEVVSWDKHEEEISAFIEEMQKNNAFSTEYSTTKVPCFFKSEKDNEYDKNALLVGVKCRVNGNKWYFVGYVPSDLTTAVRRGRKLVDAGTHYWRCTVSYSVVDGTHFYIDLNKSLFTQ